MEVAVGAKLQYPSLVGSEVFPEKSSGSLRFSGKFGGQRRLQVSVSARVRIVDGHRSNPLAVSCSYNNYAATTLNSDSPHIAFDEALVLKNKSQKIEPYLSGRCVYLVGMMGSGKTTVGKILSQVLDYSFFDSDTLVEQEVNGKSVAEIFKHHGEGFFRDKETEVLQKLSLMHRLVVSTGGGAVIRPINWKYMQKGVSVWLDVPLVALAKRIAAVGTNSRPLLHHESGDAYSKAFNRLTALFEERGEAYANANARVSLEELLFYKRIADIAAKLGHEDVSNLTPTDIAVEALEQIESYLKEEGSWPLQGCEL